MPWAVTLSVTSCSSGATLSGAYITDGTLTYNTDPNGQFIAIIDDTWHTYIVNIGKLGYVERNFSMNRRAHEGTIQTVCLNTAPPPPPSSGGGGGGW